MAETINLNPNKIKKLKDNVYKFLEKYKVNGGPEIKYTHVSMGDSFLGKFNLDKKARKEFNKLYIEAVEYGAIFSIAEKPKDYGPLLIDIDLELPIDNYDKNTRLYNDNIIIEIIDTYKKAITKYLDLNNQDFEVALIEKEAPTKKATIVKDGFHLIFYNICANYKIRHIIREEVIELLENSDIFNGFINTVDKIVDKAVVSTNCWLMYGSKKNDGYLYKLTKILSMNNEELEISKVLNNKGQCVKMFSLQDKIWNEDTAQPYVNDMDESIIDEQYKKISDKNTYNKNNNLLDIPIAENKEDDIRRSRYFVTLLSEDRANDYQEWIRVGWALHNIDLSLLDSWIDFSKLSNKYKDGDCNDRWYKMRNDGLTIRSLMLWAEQDNYTKYHQFVDREFNDVLLKSLDGSTYYIAKALHNKFINKFICTSLDNNIWYEFKNHRWFKIKHGHTLQREISESFANEYLKLVAAYSLKATKMSGIDREEIQKKASNIQKIASKLMDITFKEKIMKEAKSLFYDSEFEERLDEDYNLIGFNNGIYDLENNVFRDGRPDDFISKTTNNDYIKFKQSHPYYDKMTKFFEQILPDDAVRKYLLLTLATCVSGHNKEEKLYIATGCGSNGKSLLFNLVSLALGEYYLSCQITIITRKRGGSGQASPELLRLKGARCGCFQETDDGERLNVGMMKEITGNDRFVVRGLYSDPIEVKPQIKFFLACNQLPAVPSSDGGTWRRLRVTNFGSKFVEKPEKPNEFLIDNTLKEKIKDWGPLFASYLIHLYVNEYKKLPYLSEPDAVKLSTESYKMENDHFTEFFINRIQYTGIKKDSIGIKAMYDEFKAWFKHSHEGVKVSSQVELNKFLFEKIGEPKASKWKCYTFNNDEQDKSDDDDDCQPKSALDI
jgi:P4 family phage/plasmid primase-like protien